MDLNTDLEALASYGLAGLRRHRLERITREAYDQGALLSYEDLAMILTTSPATVKRDVHQYVDLLPAKLKKSMSKNVENEEIVSSSSISA